jgi:hypothetical protein
MSVNSKKIRRNSFYGLIKVLKSQNIDVERFDVENITEEGAQVLKLVITFSVVAGVIILYFIIPTFVIFNVSATLLKELFTKLF